VRFCRLVKKRKTAIARLTVAKVKTSIDLQDDMS